MARELIIVARENAELLEQLQREFAGQPDVTVVVDRRKGERRGPRVVNDESRRHHRAADEDAAGRRGGDGHQSVMSHVSPTRSLPKLRCRSLCVMRNPSFA